MSAEGLEVSEGSTDGVRIAAAPTPAGSSIIGQAVALKPLAGPDDTDATTGTTTAAAAAVVQTTPLAGEAALALDAAISETPSAASTARGQHDGSGSGSGVGSENERGGGGGAGSGGGDEDSDFDAEFDDDDSDDDDDGGGDGFALGGTDASSDVWSLGCLLFELATGEYLFADGDWSRFYQRVTGVGFGGWRRTTPTHAAAAAAAAAEGGESGDSVPAPGASLQLVRASDVRLLQERCGCTAAQAEQVRQLLENFFLVRNPRRRAPLSLCQVEIATLLGAL